jgi:hypothetical protein
VRPNLHPNTIQFPCVPSSTASSFGLLVISSFPVLQTRKSVHSGGVEVRSLSEIFTIAGFCSLPDWPEAGLDPRPGQLHQPTHKVQGSIQDHTLPHHPITPP